MTDTQKKQIFKLWDALGEVSFKTTKYLGTLFGTYGEYISTVSEYYGIPEDSFFEYVAEEILNRFNSTERPLCKTKFKDVSLVKERENLSDPYAMRLLYDGFPVIGSGLHLSFKYIADPTFECPPEYSEEIIDYEMQCYDDNCVYPLIRPVMRDIEKKYGIRIGRVMSEPFRKNK